MSQRWSESEWKDVEDGDEESNYSVHQILSFLRGAYRDRDYDNAEKLLTLREIKIKKDMVEEVERLKKKVKEMEEYAEKLEVEKGLRKKAEVELKVAESKYEELEMKYLSMRKDIKLLRSLEAGEKGSGMEVDEAVVESEPEVELSSDLFRKKSGVVEGKTVETKGVEGDNPVSPVSAAGMKQSVPEELGVDSEKQATDDRIPRNEHGSCIEISSSGLEFGANIPSDDDHGTPEVSSGLKKKCVSPNNEDRAERNPQSPPGQSSGLGIRSSGQLQGITRGPRNPLDDEEYRKSLLDRLLSCDPDQCSSSSDSSS